MRQSHRFGMLAFEHPVEVVEKFFRDFVSSGLGRFDGALVSKKNGTQRLIADAQQSNRLCRAPSMADSER